MKQYQQLIRCFKLILFIFFILFLTKAEDYCLAAEGGARPISMGGAFIALADDVHAVSWNPAGLAWQTHQEISYSGIFIERNDYISADFISDDYIAYAQPISKQLYLERNDLGGFGIYFHNSIYENENLNSNTALWQTGIAYGRRFSFNENMAWGMALNYYYFDLDIPGLSDNSSAFSLNIGYLWYISENFSVGFLLENINEPTYTLFGAKNRLIRVLRPAIAYFFNEKTVITLDIYDLTGNTKDRGADLSQDIRIGFEHYIIEPLSVRLGLHHLNSDTDSSKFYSLGIGWQFSDYIGIYPVGYYIDYSFIFWPDAPTGMEDYTHQLGVTLKF